MGGISIENYRQRIGCFQVSGRKNNVKFLSSHQNFAHFKSASARGRKSTPKFCEMILCAIFYISIFTIIFSSNHIDEENPNYPRRLSTITKDPFVKQTNSKFYWATSKTINKVSHVINGNRRKQGYKYFSWNCDRGFLTGNKIEDLKCFAQRSKSHIISVSEVNLTRDENNTNDNSTNKLSTSQVMDQLKIPGYSLILPESWQLHKKARIILYVSDELNFKTCKLNDDEKHLQTITLEVGFGRSSKHFVNFFYREWTSCVTGENDLNTQNENLKKLMTIWQRCTDTDRDFVSLGDMNLCALLWNDPGYAHSALSSVVHDFMLSENCHQLVNQYTRIRSVNGSIQRSCLDHVMSNCIPKMSTPEVVGISKSDHLGVSIVKAAKEVRTSPNTTKKRIYKNFCKDSFIDDIKVAKANGLFGQILVSEDINEATEIFTKQFSEILDKHAPLKIIQNRSNYVPYISKDITESMAERDKWKEVAAKSGDIEDFDKYKEFRNKVTSDLRNAKKGYYESKFADENASVGDVWKNAYTLLGSFRSSFPSHVVIFGNLVSKPIRLATEMNKYFIQKISEIKEESINNDTNHDEATIELKKFLRTKKLPQNEFKLREVN